MSEQRWQVEQDGLVISASRVNGKGTVAWCGVSDSRTPGLFLRPVLRDLLEKMKGAEVTVDFTRLEYMNSATVSPLLHCIRSMDAEGTAVTVRFTDADWQRTHLQCLRSIARTLSRVRVEAKAAL